MSGKLRSELGFCCLLINSAPGFCLYVAWRICKFDASSICSRIRAPGQSFYFYFAMKGLRRSSIQFQLVPSSLSRRKMQFLLLSAKIRSNRRFFCAYIPLQPSAVDVEVQIRSQLYLFDNPLSDSSNIVYSSFFIILNVFFQFVFYLATEFDNDVVPTFTSALRRI